MKYLKKTVSLILALMLLLSLTGLPAFAEGEEGGGEEEPQPTDTQLTTPQGEEDSTEPPLRNAPDAGTDPEPITQRVTIEETAEGITKVAVEIAKHKDLTLQEFGNDVTSDSITVNSGLSNEVTFGFEQEKPASGETLATPDTVTINTDINVPDSDDWYTELNSYGLVIYNYGSLTVNAEGSVTAHKDGVIASNLDTGSLTVSVDGDVSGKGTIGLSAKNTGGNTSVTVGGNVTGNSWGIYVDEMYNTNVQEGPDGGISIDVSGEVKGKSTGIIVYNNSNNLGNVSVTVDNGVTAGDTGIYACNAANATGTTVINVTKGGVTSTNKAIGYDVLGHGIDTDIKGGIAEISINGDVSGATAGIDTNNTGGSTEIKVTGNVLGTEGRGIQASNRGGTTTIEVDGDVSGEKTGIAVEIKNNDTAKSSIIVEGTLSATGDEGHVISLNVPEIANSQDLQKVKDALPEIIVQSIKSDADYVVCTDASGQNIQEVADAMRDSIKYIVETEVQDKDGNDSTVTVNLVNYNDSEGGVLETKELSGRKTLMVTTTETKLVLSIDKTKGTIVGVKVGNEKSEANPNGNTITHDEENDRWIITVGIGGGLTITATIGDPKPEPEAENKSESKAENSSGAKAAETAAVKKEESKAEVAPAATGGNALVTVDYKNHTLIIDMTTTPAQTFLTDTMRHFQKDSGVETVVIRVANGSFTMAMDDLMQTLGTAPSFTLKVAGDTLSITAGGNEIATLVMA